MTSATSTVSTIDGGTTDEQGKATVADQKPKAQPRVVRGNNAAEGLSGKRVTITINVDRDEAGGEAVLVGHNGVMYQIPRGTPQDVPVEIVQVLKDAKHTLMHTGPGGVPVETTVPRYSFQIES